MTDTTSRPTEPKHTARQGERMPVSRTVALVWVIAVGSTLALMYWPLISWLGHKSLQMQQLQNGALLVIFAMILCVRETLQAERPRPHINNQGIVLLILGFACVYLAKKLPRLAFPLLLLSFCLSFAAVVSFLFGRVGVKRFLPVLAGLLVFGLLVGMVPKLDWPLRAIAAKYSAQVLSQMDVPVQSVAIGSRPPELLMKVGERIYIVAAECNGFGLLTSSLLLATILAFQYELPWLSKFGLFVFAVPVALICNFLRIVGICLAVPKVSLKYDVIHEGVGTVFYLIGLAIVFVAARYSRHGDEQDLKKPETMTAAKA